MAGRQHGQEVLSEAHLQARQEVVGSNPALPSSGVGTAPQPFFSFSLEQAAARKKQLTLCDGVLRLECRQGAYGGLGGPRQDARRRFDSGSLHQQRDGCAASFFLDIWVWVPGAFSPAPGGSGPQQR